MYTQFWRCSHGWALLDTFAVCVCAFMSLLLGIIAHSFCQNTGSVSCTPQLSWGARLSPTLWKIRMLVPQGGAIKLLFSCMCMDPDPHSISHVASKHDPRETAFIYRLRLFRLLLSDFVAFLADFNIFLNRCIGLNWFSIDRHWLSKILVDFERFLLIFLDFMYMLIFSLYFYRFWIDLRRFT